MANSIILKKFTDIHTEYAAEEAITPGQLVELTATGGIVKNTVAATKPSMMVALADNLQGKTIEASFAIGDPVPCWVLIPGEEAQLRAGAAIALGAQVETNDAGLVVPLASGVAVGVCIKAVTEAGLVQIRIA